jgi:hypothetical protein
VDPEAPVGGPGSGPPGWFPTHPFALGLLVGDKSLRFSSSIPGLHWRLLQSNHGDVKMTSRRSLLLICR